MDSQADVSAAPAAANAANAATDPTAGASVYARACPSRRALELVAGKWALLIFPALAAGPTRNGELLRRIEGISQKVLTQTLKELERNGLVLRCALSGERRGSLHVEYELTALGQSLSDTLLALDNWAERHHGDLQAARERFDARVEEPEAAAAGRLVHRLR
ncbi:MAG: putative HTH-type transcriptional regulator YybR [Herbaspirillum frisingense]|uniref:Putative HTH-type transcriptional regulator YybR n=1 Tax=Herbaspirillum frisingense TaxID=92645 RepID=A0A7V8FY04_9BURK|nr:MAG: putative HTH-type transcriptional regulator YybR [Herbaspirillum frisingense]